MLKNTLDYINSNVSNMYMPSNSVQNSSTNASTQNRRGNQTVTNAILSMNENGSKTKNYNSGHGAIIQMQGHAGNKQMLDQMLKNSHLSSGRPDRHRNNVNSTTIRTEASQSNQGRMYIKKALSPSYENQMNNLSFMNQN